MILAQKLPDKLETQDIVINGMVIGLPVQRLFQHNLQRWQFDFAPLPFEEWPNPGYLRLYWYGNPPHPLRPGECWQLTVRLKRAHGMLNPGGFDYEGWLFQRRIRATGSVRSKKEAFLISGSSALNIDSLRYRLTKEIQKTLGDSPMTAILTALALGERQGISQQQRDILQKTGIAHLISISGLHIGFVAWLTFWVVRRLWGYAGQAALRLPSPHIAACFSLLAAFFYALLAGFSLPTQRALIMITVVVAGIVFARQVAVSHILAFTLLLILLWEPLSVWSITFWLSFGAVTVMAYALNGRREQKRSLLGKWGLNFWKTQWAVTLGLFPIILAIFGYIPLISPLANAIAIPWISFVVIPLTLLGTASLLFFPILASLLLHTAVFILEALWVSMDYLAHIQWNLWQQPIPPLWTVLIAMLGIAILLLPRGFPARWLGVIWLLPIFLVRPTTYPNRGEVWFTLLDIGQGLAAVVRTQNYVLLYDTGTKFSSQAVILPFFRAQGIQKIDKLLISHDDQDHTGGIHNLLENLQVDEILTSLKNDFKYKRVRLCQTGQYWHWDNVDFQILHPPLHLKEKDNNRSCVLKVSTKGGSLLLPGDIEKKIEYRLIQRYHTDLKSDILIVPHHGSATSSSENFIDAVQPRIALFSVGYRNRFGHPKKYIVQRYHRRRIKTWETAQVGAIQFQLSNNGISVPTLAREAMRRYWHD